MYVESEFKADSRITRLLCLEEQDIAIKGPVIRSKFTRSRNQIDAIVIEMASDLSPKRFFIWDG